MTAAEMALAAGVAVLVACAMEPWSRFVHGRLWHTALYAIHRTHHPAAAPARPALELNDVFSLVHAVPAAVALVLGFAAFDGLLAAALVGVGVGLSVYGVAYAVVHDGLVHGRLPVGFLRRFRALRRIRAAHEVHHRDGGPPYGLFLGPAELKRARAAAGRWGPRASPPRSSPAKPS